MNGIIEDEVAVGTPIGEIIPPESKAAELFVPNGLDKIIALIRKEVEQHQPDISTEKGRKAIASLARKVSSSMARLEDYGKNLSMNIKRQATDIDAERKRMKETLSALRDQARKPLTDYEQAEESRVGAHEQALLDLTELGNVPFGASVEEIQSRLDQLDGYAMRDWQEFAARFSATSDLMTLRLGKILEESKQRDAQQAAFAKLEAERIERESKEAKERQAKEQAERDERIAREATERAERESAEREAAAKRNAEAAEARAAKAQADLVQAEARAAQAQLDAVAAEQKRAADAKAREAAEAQARANDQAHKAEVHSTAEAALFALGLSDKDAEMVITAIAQGQIPNIKVVY